MSRRHEPREQVYAVIRFDPDMREPEHQVTVTGVLRSAEAAQAEVRRLNELNEAKGCRYFWQPTRLFSPDAAAGDGAG